MAGEKIETQIKKKEKQVKQIMDIKGESFKEWYLELLTEYVENNLDSIFELIGK